MSDELVLRSYINDHNGNMPTNPNKLVGYSCERLDLPTLDYLQARNIMGRYQSNNKSRSRPKKPKNDNHPKSKYKQKKRKRHHNHSASTKKDNSNHNRKHHHTHRYQTQYKQPQKQYRDSSNSEQTQDTEESTSSSKHQQQPYTHNTHKYTSPKQTKYHQKNAKQSRKIRQQNKQSDSSDTQSIATSSSDDNEHRSFKPKRRKVAYSTPTQPQHKYKDRREHYNKRPQQHSYHSHQRIPTESYNRNINYKKRRKMIPNTDLLRNKQRAERNYNSNDANNTKARGDFAQHSGYSMRSRRNDRYNQRGNKKVIELETPRYEQDQQASDDDSFDYRLSTDSSHSAQSSSHSSTISLSSTSERAKRKQPVKYTVTNNAEIALETIPTKIIRRSRNSAEKSDVPRKVTLKQNEKTKTNRDGNETKMHKTAKPAVLENDQSSEKETDDNHNMDTKCKITLCVTLTSLCCLTCFGVILAVILLPLSIKRVEFNESAIRYNDLTKKTEDGAYTEGRYLFTPQTKLFTYDTIIQVLSLELDCLTSDGIVMGINVSIQYSIAQNNIYKIWNEYGREGNLYSYFRLIAADSIRDSVGSFEAGSFYRNRYDIQNKIERGLFDAIKYGHTYINMTAAILSGYAFPELLKETIRMKRNAENDIDLAKNERNGNITDAETTLLISKIYAKQLEIQAKAEKESILAEAYAKQRAVRKEFEYRKQLMTNAMTVFNMTINEFVEGWLSALVLLHAHQPYTTTLVNNGNKSILMLGMTF